MSTTLTAPASPRWPLPPHGHAWRPGCIGLAVLVHMAVIGICAALVHPPVPAGPVQEQSVEWVFAPPASTEAALPAPQPQETAPPAPAPSIPAPPASAPTSEPELPKPEPPEPEAAPIPQQAEAPPPADAVPTTESAPQPEAPPQQAEAIPPAPEPAVPISPPPPPQAEALPVPPSPPTPAPRQPRHLQASRSTPKPPAAAPAAPALPAPAHDVAAATPAPRAPAGDDTAVLLTWERAVSAWLAAHRAYPYEARRRGEEGSVLLRFTADRDGRVSDVALVRSTGSPILDDAAQAAVRDATLPPFAAGMSQQRVTVTVQIRYALRN